MTSSKELKEKRGGLIKQMEDLQDKAKDSINVEQFDKINADVVAVDEQIRVTEQIEKLQSDKLERESKPTEKKEVSANNAWRELLLARGDIRDISVKSQRVIEAVHKEHQTRANAQSTTVGVGGYTIPEGFSNDLAKAELFYSDIPAVSRIIKTSTGNDLPWPKTNDTGNKAYQINEATDLEDRKSVV